MFSALSGDAYALRWLKSAAVVGGLMVIAASIGSCELRDREKQELGDEEGGSHFGCELYRVLVDDDI